MSFEKSFAALDKFDLLLQKNPLRLLLWSNAISGFLFSSLAILSTLLSLHITVSAVAFALGQYGAIFRCVNRTAQQTFWSCLTGMVIRCPSYTSVLSPWFVWFDLYDLICMIEFVTWLVSIGFLSFWFRTSLSCLDCWIVFDTKICF